MPRAADDFKAIRERMIELREPAQTPYYAEIDFARDQLSFMALIEAQQRAIYEALAIPAHLLYQGPRLR